MSVAKKYSELVKAGDLQRDDAQEACLAPLDVVLDALQQPVKTGLLSRFSAKPDPIKGLYIWGGVGRGKSMLMDMFFDEVSISEKRRVHFHAFMQEVQSALHEARKTDAADAIAPVAKAISDKVRLLCFDEMQITDIADAMIVGRLFGKLFEAGVVVVTTSNRHPDDLYKQGLNRHLFEPFIALLKEHVALHELVSQTDYRQDRLAGEQVYFSPADSQARRAIDAIWDSLTGGKAAPLELVVKARKVELPAFHNGAARVGFFDLCGRALGPADYLAVAEAVRVLILENIPALSRSNFNEAKRFVTLIDALYEAKTRLICSAADIPERLYLEGEGAFEFERTASRLREMQSEGWGDDNI